MTLKTDNQLITDIVGFTNSFLNDFNITGWQVLQLYQPVKLTTIEPTIYITITNKKRNGWQARYYPIIDNNLNIEDKYIQEYDVQFSAVRTREITDTKTTISSADILELLKTYMLNPNTLLDLKGLGYLIYQPTDIQKQDFTNDSDNFDLMPFFNVTFIYNQSLISSQAAISEYKQTIERLNYGN
jgi:hypothetical protein